MKVYLLSLGAGLLVGIVYSLLNVRSPAPPIIALVGLLGILIGEHILPVARTLWGREPLSISWQYQIRPHMLGYMPTGSIHSKTAHQNKVGLKEGNS